MRATRLLTTYFLTFFALGSFLSTNATAGVNLYPILNDTNKDIVVQGRDWAIKVAPGAEKLFMNEDFTEGITVFFETDTDDMMDRCILADYNGGYNKRRFSEISNNSTGLYDKSKLWLWYTGDIDKIERITPL